MQIIDVEFYEVKIDRSKFLPGPDSIGRKSKEVKVNESRSHMARHYGVDKYLSSSVVRNVGLSVSV